LAARFGAGRFDGGRFATGRLVTARAARFFGAGCFALFPCPRPAAHGPDSERFRSIPRTCRPVCG